MKLTPASFDTHVMRYCGDPGCRGHRLPRPPAPPATAFAMPKPRRQAQPMDDLRRVEAYAVQVGSAARPLALTARQRRQAERMRWRAEVRAAKD